MLHHAKYAEHVGIKNGPEVPVYFTLEIQPNWLQLQTRNLS